MTVTTTEGFLEIGPGRTWYRVHRGEGVTDDAVPLLLLHGGPGGASLDGIPFIPVVAEDRPVIEYDQLDCGRSDRVGDTSRWTAEALVDELGKVRAALGLDQVHLWGQSWGGTLAVAYLLTRPTGVRSLTTSGSPISCPMWLDDARRARAALPASTRRALLRCEATLAAHPHRVPEPGPGPSNRQLERAGRWMARLFPALSGRSARRVAIAASRVPFLRPTAHEVLNLELTRRHVLFGLPRPPAELLGITLAMNRAMYQAMWGPSEFVGTGPIAALDLLDRLPEIETPVLVTSGVHEMASPAQMRLVADLLPDARWELFEHSSHCQPYEEPERYTAVLHGFLAEIDALAVA